MKAKHFKKLRKLVKRYKVSHRERLMFDFENEKEIIGTSPENACMRYHKRTGCFVNKRYGDVEQTISDLARFKIEIGNRTMYFD